MSSLAGSTRFSAHAQAPGTARPSLRAAAPRRPLVVAVRAAAEPSTSSDEAWEFCMSKEALLKAPNMRAQGDIDGIGKVAVFWFKNEPYAVQGQCPHLGIPLAGGQISPEGSLVCSQHKSSWDLKSGEVDEWLPGNFINAFQRVVSKPCPLEKFECKVEDGNVYVRVP